MVTTRIWTAAWLVGAVAMLGGCVVAPLMSVVPGQGKTYADLQRDDTACRAAPVATATAPAADGAYYQCMAAHGESVVANRTAAYPAYAGSPYYPYGGYPAYGYPAYGYPYYGYPYSAAYYGSYLGLGLGAGLAGGFYGGGFWHGGYGRGGYGRGGYGRGGYGRGGYGRGGFGHGGFEHGGHH